MRNTIPAIIFSLSLMVAIGAAAPTPGDLPMPADFLKVESAPWTRWLDETLQITWARVPLKDVLAGEFGPAALAIEPQDKLTTPITFDASKLSRRITLWRMSQQHGFTVRWAQRGEPRTFMGLLETEKWEGPVGGATITTMTQVMRADHETYQQWKRTGKIKKEEILDGDLYFAVEISRDIRFDHASAWVHVVERYKKAAPTTQPAGPDIFQITCEKPADAMKATAADGKTVLDMTSRSGIGGATIERQAEHWPDELVLRLRLQGLESLTISAGNAKLDITILSHSGFPRMLKLWNGKEAQPMEKNGPYWTYIRAFDADGKPAKGLPGAGGWFEMTIPKAMLTDQVKTITLRWIDFYRG